MDARPIRTLVVDDDALARDTLRNRLKGDPEIELLPPCRDGNEALEAIHQLDPDLVFLKEQLPMLDGFAVLEALREEADMPIVVLLSEREESALEAFDREVVDYLVEPFAEERFERALARAKRRIRERRDSGLGQRLRALMETTSDNGAGPVTRGRAVAREGEVSIFGERLLIRENSKVVPIRTDELVFVRAARNYVRCHVEGREYLVRITLSDMLARLDPERFARIHRSTIVNLDFIEYLKAQENGTYRVVLKTGAELVLSRRYRDQMIERTL